MSVMAMTPATARTIDWQSLLWRDLPNDAAANGFAVGAVPSTGCGPEKIAVGIDEDAANRPATVGTRWSKVMQVGVEPGPVAPGGQLEHRAIPKCAVAVSGGVQISRRIHCQAVFRAAVCPSKAV